jgi:hypothetical protein
MLLSHVLPFHKSATGFLSCYSRPVMQCQASANATMQPRYFAPHMAKSRSASAAQRTCPSITICASPHHGSPLDHSGMCVTDH